ncbi:MAG: type II toxin-antitoxin system PemK/MazF family toxin [Maricaulaceae bacterium]|nr:type II toxin-antitoxin system PemK/MazF family toxin [Maricaulaceae bacterium]
MPASDAAPARGDVVVLPFPYSDRLAEKRRPALVVSAPSLCDRYGLVWVAMITSAANPRWPCDVPVRDLTAAGLPVASVVRPAKIACIEQARIIRRSGRLIDGDMRKADQALKAFLGV